MYPSIINYNKNPLSFDSQNNHHIPQNYIENDPISKLDDFPSSSSFKDLMYELTWQQLHDHLLFHQQPLKITTDDDDVVKLDHVPKANETQTTSRKRASRKDRHSKIFTAQGLRDRRMRISLPVAHKFFALQDLLGFDKASKTIEWLLIQSSSAIKQIMNISFHQKQDIDSSNHSTSEPEANSGIDESTNNEIPQVTKSYFNEGNKEIKLARGPHRDPRIAKESRNIAREKARKRTIEKKKFGEYSKVLDSNKRQE